MSQGATKEEELGKLHQLIYKQYVFLCSDPKVPVEDKDGNIKNKRMLTPKELITALSGGAKFLNDNDVKAPRFVSDTSELAETLNKRKKRSFDNVIDIKEQQSG